MKTLMHQVPMQKVVLKFIIYGLTKIIELKFEVLHLPCQARWASTPCNNELVKEATNVHYIEQPLHTHFHDLDNWSQLKHMFLNFTSNIKSSYCDLLSIELMLNE
jgi:hypothetical protein